MAVDNVEVVDAIGIESASGVVALISDHLEWDSDNDHLRVLQKKIDRYLAFIDSGQVFESYHYAVGKSLRIDVICKFHPSESAELEARIKRIDDWNGLRALWSAIEDGKPAGWDGGEALEYLVIRAFELDPDEPAVVRYPYEVSLFEERVEEIDGAVHLQGLSCLVESKDWGRNVAVAPIVKMRSQLLRRPAGTIGLMFTKSTFTIPAKYLAHFTMPQAVLLWSGFDVQVAMDEGRICKFLRLKHRVCCEDGIPDYDLRERSIP